MFNSGYVTSGPPRTPRGMRISTDYRTATFLLRERWAARFGWDYEVGERIEADLGFGWFPCWVQSVEFTPVQRYPIGVVVLVSDQPQAVHMAFAASKHHRETDTLTKQELLQ